MPFVHRLRVRYHECDAQGFVFNANHFAYFDVALTELWRDRFGSYQSLVDSGADVVVRDAQATFHAPARFDDELDFEVRLTRLGETAMSTRIDASTAGRPVVEGMIRHVFIDPATKAKRPMPAHVREGLSGYVDEGAESGGAR